MSSAGVEREADKGAPESSSQRTAGAGWGADRGWIVAAMAHPITGRVPAPSAISAIDGQRKLPTNLMTTRIIVAVAAIT
jgi:hypothetical protein